MKASAARRIDRAYHLVDPANWSSIQRHGLLSTAALLDRSGLAAAERGRLLRRHRQTGLTLPDGAVIRDQRPMPPAALARCLHDMQPEDWYALLNAKVFFWLDPDRLNRQHRAGNAGAPALVMIIDAAQLLRQHGDRAAVTPFNTGNARRKPAPRGQASFVPYTDWQASGWASEARLLGTRPRSPSHAPVELAIADAVPDVMRFVVAVRNLQPGELFTA